MRLGWVFVAAAALSACDDPGPHPPEGHAPSVPQPLCSPFADGDDFSDLVPLERALASARVVALGEPTHLDGSAFLVKARLVRFLHERLGFGVLAWESSLWACEAEPSGCLSWPWVDVAEVDSIRSWAPAHGMRITGFDPSIGGPERLPMLERFVSERLGSDAVLVGRLHTAFGRFPKARSFRKLDVETRAADEGAFADALARARQLTPGRDAMVLAQTLEGILSLYRWHAAVGADRSSDVDWRHHPELNDVRDRAMAENVRWLLETRYPGEKIVLWTANVHGARDAGAIDGGALNASRTMGSWLSEWLRPAYAAVATTAYGGRIANPPAPGRALEPARAESIEAMCPGAGTSDGLLLLDHTVRVGRFVGLADFRADWGRMFDAGIVIGTMRPATPLSTSTPAPEGAR